MNSMKKETFNTLIKERGIPGAEQTLRNVLKQQLLLHELKTNE